MANKKAPPQEYVRHTGGEAWGVGVLVGRTSDQRTYLFADGVQRSFKEAFCDRFIVPATAPEEENQVRLARGLKAGSKATPKAVNLELEAQIRANPDDPAPYLVYADWLLQRSDPRGQLITLQHQLADGEDRSKRTAEKKLLGEHGAYFHPPAVAALLAVPKRGDANARTAITWRTGYYERVRIARQSEHQPELEPTLTELLAHPSAAYLRAIVLGALAGKKYLYGPLLDVIKRAKPPLLEELVIGDFTEDRNELRYSSAGNVTPLFAALPALARLRIRAGTVRFDTAVKHAHLRELSITTFELTATTRNQLSAAQLPALETLELSGDVDPSTLIARDQFPALRRLALRHTRATDRVLYALLRSPLFAHLEVLELTDGDLQDPIVPAAAIKHLRRLDLSGNPLPRPAVIKLAQLPNVTVERTQVAAAPISVADVEQLADDDAIAKARSIARPSKWFALAREGNRLTGRYRGNGIYFVSAQLDRNDADCTCRSPSNPCKHALALLLIAASGYAFRS